MPKDLRDLMAEKSDSKHKLSDSHRVIFERKLSKELHQKRWSFYKFSKIAAIVVMLVGIPAILFTSDFYKSKEETHVKTLESLGSISPEFKKIESFYLASIQSELLSIEETPENRELLDGYLQKIDELTKEYKVLTIELTENGLNEKTINALIENLQLRLNLLYNLKEQLSDLQTKNMSQNEKNTI